MTDFLNRVSLPLIESPDEPEFVAIGTDVHDVPAIVTATHACERPECGARVTAEGLDKYAAQRAATFRAEELGWQILTLDGKPLRLCTAHVDLTKRIKITPLFDEYGVALPPRGRR